MKNIQYLGLTFLIICFEAFSDELPVGFDGIFHLPNKTDAFNLQVNKNGTFSWRVWGCDYGNGGDGVWKKIGDELVLEPIENRELKWIGKGVMFPVKQVKLSSQIQDEIQAEITTFTEPQKTIIDNPQVWKRGEVCAQCGELLGPTGPAMLCSEMKSTNK
jgi:hypothetical protein